MLQIPTNCPSCASLLERVKDQLFCRNSECSATSLKKIEKFTKTMKIMGLGQKTIEKLGLTSINKIYELTSEDVFLKLGEKLGTKLLLEIEKSKVIKLSIFLSAMSIPLIGKTASEKIESVTNEIYSIDLETCTAAGLGDKAAISLISWVNVEYKDNYKSLPIVFKSTSKAAVQSKLKIVITGKLNDYSSRNKAKDYLLPLGVEVLSSLSSKIDYLICDIEGSISSSSRKAKALNIPIITMNELINII